MDFMLQRGIKPESIWNIDETGFRIGILGGEKVIIPRTAKELYTLSPKNHTSITINVFHMRAGHTSELVTLFYT